MATTVPLLDNDVIEFGAEEEANKFVKHPFVTAFHVLFRSLALIVYILCGFYGDSFIGSFVVIILLLSIDFWVVKNITGRLMVGLRWWNYIDEEGNSHWVYEARKSHRQGRVTTFESQVFWAALVAAPVMWTILFLIAIARFNFKWLMVVCIALSLSGSNLYGYIRCKMGKSDSLGSSVQNIASGIMQRQIFSQMRNMFTRSPATTRPNTIV